MQSIQSAKIALLIDFDNVILGVEDPGFDVELVVNALRSRGVVVMGRAYGDWYRHHRHRRKLMEQGIELVETPAFGPLIKNSADIRIVIDGLDIAAAHTHIDTYCLVSGDSDFLPLIKRLQLLGKNVIVIAGNKFTSDLVRRNCNEYVSYENLLAESVGATEDATTLEGAFHLLGRAISTLEERDMEIRSSAVKQMMLQLNPVFSERTFGCYQFKQFLDRAARAGMVTLLERDGNGEHSVELRDRTQFTTVVQPESSTREEFAPVNESRGNGSRPSFAPEKSSRERMQESSRSGRRFGRRGKNEAASDVAPLENEGSKIENVAIETPAREPRAEKSNAKPTPLSANGPISASVLTSRPGVRRGRLRFSAKSGRVETQWNDESSTPGENAAENIDINEAAPVEQTLDLVQSPENLLPPQSDGFSDQNADLSQAITELVAESPTEIVEPEAEVAPTKRGSRGGRRRKTAKTDADALVVAPTSDETPQIETTQAEPTVSPKTNARSGRLAAARAAKAALVAATPDDAAIVAAETATEEQTVENGAEKKTSRGRRGGVKRTAARKAKDSAQNGENAAAQNESSTREDASAADVTP